MDKMSLDELLNIIEETDYYTLFRPLLGYDDFITFYQGIDDSMEHLLDELQDIVGFEFPGDLIYILLMTNGAKIFDLTLFSLTQDKDNKNGLYYNNVTSPLRNEYQIPSNYLIIGRSDDVFVLCAFVDEHGYISYALWEKETNEASIIYDYVAEIIMGEIDYYTGAFSKDEEEEEEE